MEQEQQGFGHKFGKTMDHVFGTIVLGGVGHAAYHMGKVPGVGKAGAYVRENVREGFHEAEKADRIRTTAGNISKIMNGGGNVSAQTIASMCRDAGVDEGDVTKVRDLAHEKAGKASRSDARTERGQIPAPNAA